MKKKRRLNRTIATIIVLLIAISSFELFFSKPKSVFADSTFSMNEGYGTAVSDSTGNVSGTITNAVWKQEDLCKVGKCIYFDGTGDLISFADNSNLDFGASNAFTLEGWFRTPDITSGQRAIIAKHNATAGGYKVYMDSNGYLIFGIDDDSTWTPDDTASTTATAFDDNKWHFFSAVKTKTDITIYVDGVQYQTDSSLTATGTLANANSFYVGMDGNGTSNGFSGFLDEIRILKSAKTAEEVKTDYAGQSKTITGAGPVGWWKMDEAVGTNAYDSSGNENTGTWNGNTTSATGKFGSSYTFDGTGDYVDVGSGSTLDNISALTISTWLYNNVDSGRIVDKQTNLNTAGWQIELKNTGSDVQLQVDYDGAADLQVEANTNLATATWYHVAVTWDGTANASGVKIYINGVLQKDLTNNISGVGNRVDDGAQSMGLACRVSGASQCTSGRLDDFKIYDYVRSQSQILEDLQGYLPAGTAASFGPDQSHLSDGLVGYWKMDEASWTNNCSTATALDLSGNSNGATSCPNTTGPTGASSGKFGNSGSFDGTDDYLESTSPSLLLANSVTVSSWINITSAGTTARKYIVNTTNSNQGYALTQTDTTPTMKFSIGDGTSYVYANGATTLTTGVWYHVVGTADNLGNVKVYVNGVLDGESTATGPMQLPSGINFRIGTRSTNNYFNGKIDETRIYNRTLSPAEVRQLYNFAPGPIGRWNMDEGVGTTTNDSSGNGNVGTLVNNPSWNNGKNGGSVYFDGVDDYVDFGDPFYSDSLTIEAWFKPVTVDGTTYKNIVVKRNGSGVTAGNNEYEITINNTRTIVWNAWDSGGVGISNMSSSTAVELNKWHHVAVTYSGVSRMAYLYVDGIVEDTDTPTGAIGDTTSKLQLGARSGSNNSRYFNGLIDQVAVYNYARTAGQVSESFGSGVVNPVAYWKFDEGSGTTANDSASIIGSSENLTLSTATSSWSNSGKDGKAFSAGGSRWLTRSDDPYLDFVNSESFSISFWMKSSIASAANPSATEYIVNKPPSGAANGGYAVYANTSGQICLGIDDDNTSFPEDSSCTSVDVYDNAWHHVTAIKTEASSIKVYVDAVQSGTPDVSISASVNTLANSSTFYVGSANAVNDTDDFNGDLDDLQIFRGSITTDQVKVLFGSGNQATFGAISVSSAGVVDNSAGGEYCVPGDATSCLPPVGHWRFEEKSGTTANDVSGNGYSGTLTNSPTWGSGKFGGGVNTNSASAYVNIGDPVSGDLDFNTTEDFTVSAWIRTSSSLPNNGEIMYKGFGGSDPGYRLRLASTTGYFNCEIADNAAGTTQLSSGGPALNDGKWHYVGCVLSGSGTQLTAYVDGIARNTVADSEGPLLSAKNLEIGRNSATSYFPGDIDDVRIYRYARTPAQLAWDYNQGAPVGWWKFNECAGSTVYNSAISPTTIAGTNNGTITVGATGSYTSLGTCGSGTSTESWNGGTSGKFGGALAIDGTNDYVSLTNNASVKNLSQFSISAWIKPNTVLSAVDNNAIYDEMVSDSSSSWRSAVTLGYNASGCSGLNTINFHFRTGLAASPRNSVCGSTVLTAGNWYHIVAIFNSVSDVHSVYVNGKLDGSLSAAVDSIANTNPNVVPVIGSDLLAPNYFNGLIDDFRIYPYALTDTQVKTVMNEGSAVRIGQ